MTRKDFDDMARSLGYDGSKFKKHWKGFDVYEAVFDTDEPVNVGLPCYLVEDNGSIRWLDNDEVFDYLASISSE